MRPRWFSVIGKTKLVPFYPASLYPKSCFNRRSKYGEIKSFKATAHLNAVVAAWSLALTYPPICIGTPIAWNTGKVPNLPR